MKPLIIVSLFLISLTSPAQTWLWVNEQPNKNPGSFGDPWGITADKNGNVIDIGLFAGNVAFGSTTLASPVSYYGNTFVAKFNPLGNALWAKQSTVPSDASLAWGTSVATDLSGNIFLAGFFLDTVTFAPYTLTNGLQYVLTGYFGNVFLVKYDSNGNVLWAKSGTMSNMKSSMDNATGVATDSSGNVYITGMFNNTLTFGSYSLIDPGLNTQLPYIAKFDPNGNVLWAKQGMYTGTGGPEDYANGIATDASGNAYIIGYYEDSIQFGSYTLNNSFNSFLVKYDPNGNVAWATSSKSNHGGCNSEVITCDNKNSIYIAGTYEDSVWFGTNSIYTPEPESFFLTKYDTSGNARWAISSASNYYLYTSAYSISASKNGNVYLCGTFNDTLTFGGITVNSLYSEPSFIYKFDSNGHAICATEVNNVNDDFNGVAADPLADDAYFNGDVEGSQCTFGDTTIYGNGEEWAFLAKWTCACYVVPTINQPDTIYAGSSVNLSAGGGINYLWSPATGLNSNSIANPVATPTVNTTYYVAVSNGSCSESDSVHVIVRIGPSVTLCCDTVIMYGNSVQLDATGGVSYAWAPSNGLSCDNCPNPAASPGTSTTYYVTIRTDSGCSVTQQVTIDVNCGQPFIPEAFSPNGDGKNDILYVRGDCINTMDFAVFDRWGAKIFETNDKNMGWDGRYKGSPMNTGSYSYYLHATLYDGSNVDKKGSITLVR